MCSFCFSLSPFSVFAFPCHNLIIQIILVLNSKPLVSKCKFSCSIIIFYDPDFRSSTADVLVCYCVPFSRLTVMIPFVLIFKISEAILTLMFLSFSHEQIWLHPMDDWMRQSTKLFHFSEVKFTKLL